MRVPLPALLCCSAASLLLLLRWRRRRGLWKKVKEAQQRQERSLVQMEMAVRRFREQVGTIRWASPPLHTHTSPHSRGGVKAEDGQNRLHPPGDGSSPWSLPLGTAPGTAVVQPFLWAGGKMGGWLQGTAERRHPGSSYGATGI